MSFVLAHILSDIPNKLGFFETKYKATHTNTFVLLDRTDRNACTQT